MNGPKQNGTQLTFGGHLEVLRRMLFRIIIVASLLIVISFVCKDATWQILLAPSECDFVTYQLIEQAAHTIGLKDFSLGDFQVDLIATDLSSQFMSHLSSACILGLLGASPYILYEIFRFISPALYKNERRMAVPIVTSVYILFIFGILMSYYVLFPISFRFLGTYSVSQRIHSTITLNSYISTFTTLTFVLGLVFQLPVIAYVLARMEMISSNILVNYRKHALLFIFILSAIITPPDVMTLMLVALPLYILYEISIRVVRWVS